MQRAIIQLFKSIVCRKIESGWSKAFSEALMKGQREPTSMSSPRGRFGKIHPGDKGFGSWQIGFPPNQTKVTSSKATVCLLCDAVGMFCVPSVQHCLTSLLLTLSHCLMTLLTLFHLPLQILHKMLYFLTNLVGTRHSLCKTSEPRLSYFLYLWLSGRS